MKNDLTARKTQQTQRTKFLFLALLLANAFSLLSGCASIMAPRNHEITEKQDTYGYRDTQVFQKSGQEGLSFGLSFSGGGTRAAALAYGVLEELSRTRVDFRGESWRMLDLVQSISSVSGGSYPAAYYGLFGERLFQDFEAKFLKHNVQDDISSEWLSPGNMLNMTSPFYGRTDVVADYFDRTLFEGKCFADMEKAMREAGRPFILINATDMARTSRFEFTQNQFDLLCSDLGPYKVSRAVAASSAVPIVFSPITLSNYAGNCAQSVPDSANLAANERRESIRHYTLLSDMLSYLAIGKRQYIHLLDGGLSDNLGLRAVLDRLVLFEERTRKEGKPQAPIRRLVQLVVNAQVNNDYPQLDQRPEVPGLASVAIAISNVTDRFNYETLAYARNSMAEFARKLAKTQHEKGMPNGDDVKALLIEISFAELEDAEERAYFNALPTSFKLPAEAVDRLREVAARLLRNSPQFQELLRELPMLD